MSCLGSQSKVGRLQLLRADGGLCEYGTLQGVIADHHKLTQNKTQDYEVSSVKTTVLEKPSTSWKSFVSNAFALVLARQKGYF